MSEPLHLTFFVGGDEFAVEVMRVREVVERMPITHVPSMPAAVRGVVNLRGQVVPVIDLGVRFAGARIEVTRRTCIVMVELVVEQQRSTMGLLVDAVGKVVTPDAVEPVPPFGTHVRVEFLRGMGLVGDSFVLLVDLDCVLSTRDLLSALGAASEPASTATEAT
jgi:purine-binding chemotaxis protein CheW